MSKFTITDIGHSDDPFGYTPAKTVEIVDRSPAPGSFRFASEDSFLPLTGQPSYPGSDRPFFDDGMPLSPVAKAMKVNLVSGRREDLFTVFGDVVTAEFSFPSMKLANTTSGSDLFQALGPSASAQEGRFTKGAAGEFSKSYAFTKVQETPEGDAVVWGVATSQSPDLDGELCHYDTAQEAYREWSDAAKARTLGAGQEVSLGNVRLQHGIEIGGKVTEIQFDDENKAILLGSVPLNDQILADVRNGFYTGYSQGGSYAWRKCADCRKSLPLQQGNNFCPDCKRDVQVLYGLKRLSEVSYVDSPCTGQGFEYVKANGSSRFVNFQKRNGRPNSIAARVVSNEPVGRGVWKSILSIDGIRRAVLHWDGGWMFAS